MKEQTLYCRISADMKERVEREGRLRGESASVIVREALREYFDAKAAAQTVQETPLAKAKRAA